MTKSASFKMAVIRTSQRTLAPPQCPMGPSLQTPNLAAYLASSDISHSAPPGLLLMKSLKPIFKWQVAVSSSLFYISAVDLLDYGEYFGKMFRGLKTGYSPFRVTVPTHHLYKQWIQSPWGPFMSWSWA